jgi:large subunit ribosomal protein L17
MFRNMVVSLFEHERIETTDAKAKELRSLAERLITKGKKNTLHSRRQAARWVRNPAILQKLFSDIAGRYAERDGGYTRIVKLGNRKGDNAPISIIELMPAGAPIKKERVEAPSAPVATKETFEAAPAAEEAVEAAPAAEEAVEAAPAAEEAVEAAPATDEATAEEASKEAAE